MSEQESTLSGPDLEEGVSIAEIPDGGVLVGHALEESVLVWRRGPEIGAIGATCSHYGGPLAGGLIDGDTVRCPWHHACFSLRTGEALRAPALNAVSCFALEQKDGLVRITGYKETVEVARPKTDPADLLIVGAGAAGNAAAERLRRLGASGRIVMIGAEASGPVDRPNLSKDYLAGTASEDWIPLRPRDFYGEHAIELVTEMKVERIDAAKKVAVLSDGTSRKFDVLLLATGAEPLRPPIPGIDRPQVHFLRSLADSQAIIARAEKGKRVIVLGASFIGLEVAASLVARGLEVHVAAPDKEPLERILGPEVGAFIRRVHASHGVEFHLGKKAVAIDEGAVRFDDGSMLTGAFIVAGLGVRPRVELAESMKLTIDRGVLVDRNLRTSAKDVFAAGDIARWPDPHSGRAIRVEHWVVAERHGQIAAANMLGFDEPCDLVPFFWSQHHDVTINYVGHAERFDQVVISGNLDEQSAAIGYLEGGTVRAIATVFRDDVALQAERAFERGDQASLRALVDLR
jgi:NADPH-dependent 2,4-dienoyl-CoA reductase/sulfur reductase-like enzyme/nitrite reductase/ring-hydroxylating ferredoxin subunit